MKTRQEKYMEAQMEMLRSADELKDIEEELKLLSAKIEVSGVHRIPLQNMLTSREMVVIKICILHTSKHLTLAKYMETQDEAIRRGES